MPNQSTPLLRAPIGFPVPGSGSGQTASTPSFQLRPMQVTWELEHALPEVLLEASQLLAAA